MIWLSRQALAPFHARTRISDLAICHICWYFKTLCTFLESTKGILMWWENLLIFSLNNTIFQILPEGRLKQIQTRCPAAFVVEWLLSWNLQSIIHEAIELHSLSLSSGCNALILRWWGIWKYILQVNQHSSVSLDFKKCQWMTRNVYSSLENDPYLNYLTVIVLFTIFTVLMFSQQDCRTKESLSFKVILIRLVAVSALTVFFAFFLALIACS